MRCDMPTRSSASCTRFLRSADGIPRYVSGSSTFSYTVRSPIRLKAWKMNPISRLRMRARSESFSPCTALPFKIYEPSLGESNKPKIASKVDLPQPEGPAIERYSPFLMCRWMPASACVSTSSVTNTFVTPSRLIKAFGSFAMYITFPNLLVQADAIMRIPGRHIRQYYLIANLQAIHNFDGVHRAASQRHRNALRFFSIPIQLE